MFRLVLSATVLQEAQVNDRRNLSWLVQAREMEYFNDNDKHFKSAGLSMYLTGW